jgi:hypothetical protein
MVGDRSDDILLIDDSDARQAQRDGSRQEGWCNGEAGEVDQKVVAVEGVTIHHNSD